jgi:hypothetical protein
MPNVYIFGAGATKAINPQAPLTQDLLPQILEISTSLHGQKHLENIRTFITDLYFYTASNELSNLPALEDILSQLDYAIGENRALGGEYTLDRLREIRESFIYAICEVLRTTLRSSSEVLNTFLEQIQEDDTIISLNYELVVDNALTTFLGRTLNYGIPTRHHKPSQNTGAQVAHRQQKAIQVPIKLYKLHGSLNWLYCPVCQEVQLTPGEHAVQYLFEQQDTDQPIQCEQCHTRYEPLIIMPSMAKTYANPLLNDIWRQAEDQLMRANHVIFLGYSMPEADGYLRYMIKRALYGNLKGFKRNSERHEPCRISVIDYDPNYTTTTHNRVFDRYTTLFGTIEYFAEGFEAYAKRTSKDC